MIYKQCPECNGKGYIIPGESMFNHDPAETCEECARRTREQIRDQIPPEDWPVSFTTKEVIK